MENMKDLVCNNFTRLFEGSDYKTYRALAAKVKINENTIQRWVKKTSYPELPNIEKLAEAFGVSPLEFYKRDEGDSKPIKMGHFLKAISSIPDDIYDLAGKLNDKNSVAWDGVRGALEGATELKEKKKSTRA